MAQDNFQYRLLTPFDFRRLLYFLALEEEGWVRGKGLKLFGVTSTIFKLWGYSHSVEPVTNVASRDLSHTKRFFITGGGTGGHIYPAVAIANSLKERGAEVFYVGNPDNLENEIAQKEGFDFLPVSISGMPRQFGFKLFNWCWKLLSATLKSIQYIIKYKPDMVFGTGGYVSAPALFAAIFTHTPFAVHDCDVMPGIVTRTVAPYAKFVSVAFEASKKHLKSKNIIVNGNPIRTDFSRYDKTSARQKLSLQDKTTIIVMGGSQGAKTINKAVIMLIEDLMNEFDIQVIHQTGKKNYETAITELEKIYPSYKENPDYLIQPYFDEMFVALKASDIAISRAGSLSISEICVSELASVLIPYPYAAADHQRKNAKEMERQNASIYLEDRDCNSVTLYKNLKNLIENSYELKELQTNAAALAKPDATEKITEELLKL